MSARAAKRQKRIESPSADATHDGPTDADSDSPEEDVRSGNQRAKPKPQKNENKKQQQPLTPTKKATAAATGRRQLANRQKRPDRSGGLRQSELSFSKAVPVPITKSLEGSPSSSAQEAKENHGELEDDLIQDDDEQDASIRKPLFVTSGSRPTSFRSVGSQSSENALSRRGSAKQTPFSAQSLRPKHQQKAVAHDASIDLPWAQRYAPRNLDELGVHKRKVADVRAWLGNVLKGYEKKRLLVLRGPSGSGKTATVQMLAQELGCSILEWKNPLATSSATGEYSSNTASLEDFLSRGQRYSSLDFEDGASHGTLQQEGQPPGDTSRIILMEELPHVFSSNSTSLRNFRESIMRYLVAEDSFFSARDAQRDRPPIVLIISESSSSSSSFSSDSLTAHRVLGPEILQHPRVTPIEFNPVATTILTKALELVLKRATQEGAAATQVSPAILYKLAERGDLRAGISALEFMCLAQSSTEHARPLSTKRSKASSKNAVLTTSEAALVEAVAQRSTMLDLFHAVGKVMYNKRQPSDHDSSFLVSEVDIDALLDDSGTDPITFIAALHENYALSCAGSSFVDALNACTEILSEADLLSGTSFYASNGAIDAASIRQSDLAAHVAVQGLLHALPYPVKRPTVASRDAFKMFWPESVRVRGRADEVMATAQRFVGRAGTIGSTGIDGASAPLLCARSTSEAFLDEVPYRALIAHARGGFLREGTERTELVAMAKLENSRWGDVQEKDNKREPWRKKTNLNHRDESNEDVDGGMSSFIRGVDEKWVLSDDDIED